MAKKNRTDRIRELAEEVDLHDDMLTSLVELLEEKGILTQREWEARIQKKIKQAAHLKSFREL